MPGSAARKVFQQWIGLGGTLTYSMRVRGVAPGTGKVTTGTSTPQVRGITVEVDRITVQ
ncbi:hypothetical protein [Nonomuraea rubra]|uniref:hypothetical protein n=1 Tax=Nonomuraea rubra TaxID=46180 RepID=UPI0033C58D3E